MATFRSKNDTDRSVIHAASPETKSSTSAGGVANKITPQKTFGPDNKRATAEYIGDMVVALREIADSSDLVFLAYLLDMAYEEAAAEVKRH